MKGLDKYLTTNPFDEVRGTKRKVFAPAVPIKIRDGISHPLGFETDGTACSFGISLKPIKITATTREKSGIKGMVTFCKKAVMPVKTKIPDKIETHQLNLFDTQAYVRLNAMREKPPLNVPRTESKTKVRSWLRARKKATGPEVSGSPTSHPLTAAPHRRPAKLAEPMMTGARINFKTKIFLMLKSSRSS